MLGALAGIVTANAVEWVVHKHVLHGRGRQKGSFWAFHWHDHHKACRTHAHVDEDYRRSVLRWNGQGKEAAALIGASVAVAPLYAAAPWFTAALHASAARYYVIHRRSHLDATWAREHLPWHFDHHMGPNQDANWCVTQPWADVVLGTRERYVGTWREKEARRRKRRRAWEQSAASKAAPRAEA